MVTPTSKQESTQGTEVKGSNWRPRTAAAGREPGAGDLGKDSGQGEGRETPRGWEESQSCAPAPQGGNVCATALTWPHPRDAERQVVRSRSRSHRRGFWPGVQAETPHGRQARKRDAPGKQSLEKELGSPGPTAAAAGKPSWVLGPRPSTLDVGEGALEGQ